MPIDEEAVLRGTLEALGKAGAGRIFKLDKPEIRLGRGADVDVRIEDPSNTLSSVHAVVRTGRDGYVLIDESRNGTSVRTGGRGRAMRLGNAPHTLADGDVIVLAAGIELRFNDPDRKRSAKGAGGPNRFFVIAGISMWVVVLAAVMLSLSKDDVGAADANTVTVNDVVTLLEGATTEAATPAARAIAEIVRGDPSGTLKKTVLDAAWAERRGDYEGAKRAWSQVYLNVRDRGPTCEPLADFARERLAELQER